MPMFHHEPQLAAALWNMTLIFVLYSFYFVLLPWSKKLFIPLSLTQWTLFSSVCTDIRVVSCISTECLYCIDMLLEADAFTVCLIAGSESLEHNSNDVFQSFPLNRFTNVPIISCDAKRVLTSANISLVCICLLFIISILLDN